MGVVTRVRTTEKLVGLFFGVTGYYRSFNFCHRRTLKLLEPLNVLQGHAWTNFEAGDVAETNLQLIFQKYTLEVHLTLYHSCVHCVQLEH